MQNSSRVAELLAITSRLIACLQQEVEFIRALRPDDVKQIQVEKAALADTYRAFVLAMKEPGPEAEALNGALRDELEEATERVQAALSENLRALRAMRDVNERVMRAIVSALDEKRNNVTGYDAKGALRKGRRTATAEPAAVQQRA
jgi:hypothetical protein